jgi:ectoine hydroxylase
MIMQPRPAAASGARKLYSCTLYDISNVKSGILAPGPLLAAMMASTRARAAVPPLVDEAARASFRTNGYLTVPGVLSPAELHELRAVADAWLDESRNTLTPTASFDLEPTHTAAAPQLRRVKNPSSSEYPHISTQIPQIVYRLRTYRPIWPPDPAFAALHTHPAILDIARTLVGDNFRGGGSKLNLKLPGGGSPVLWHQDWAFCTRIMYLP